MHAPAHYSRASIGFGRPWTPMVKMLILVNGGVFLAQIVLGRSLLLSFGLDTAHPFQLWRYVSYLFLHGSPLHLLFNMFALWMFGSDLEDYFGARPFLRYYFFTGVGAGLTVALLDLVTGQRSMVIGASGAVFGILLAFGVIYAERVITMLIFFFLPVSMKAKHFVILFALVEFLFAVSPGSSNIARFAHLGGMAFGLLYLKTPIGRVSFGRKGLLRDLKDRVHSARSARDDQRMDDLLKKVNARGIQSLTEEEKQFLHRMSRSKKWH